MIGKGIGAAGVAALLLLGACATAKLPDVTPLAIVEGLPMELAAYKRRPHVTDFEARGMAGGGASVNYDPMSGEPVVATVYVYDRGQVRQPEGGESPDVAQELQLSTIELQTLAQRGHFQSVQPDVGMDVKDPSGAFRIRCATFRIGQKTGAMTGDAVCVTVRNGRFVKIRLTEGITSEPAGAGMLASGFMSSVLDVMPPQ